MNALAAEPAQPANFAIRTRMAVMMFLQYFVQGCYAPVVSVYLKETLGFSPSQIGYFSAALSLGPLFAPFVVGQLVDRRFATERVLAFCHAVAGMLMLGLYLQKQFIPVITLATTYSLLYVPSMMLTNSLAFAHLTNRNRDFPIVRLFGTIGFIVPAWLIEPFWLSRFTGAELDQQRGVVFLLAGGVGLLMACYCLTLPHTPPPPATSGKLAPLEAARLLRERKFLVLVVVTILLGIVHQYYFTWNSPFISSVLRGGGITAAYEQRISSIGQVAEIVVMAFLGLLIDRVGFKATLLIGGMAYLTRCLLLAAAALPGPFAQQMGLLLTAQSLHGLCFGCFLATAFMYVDREAPPDVRGSAQTLYGTLILGIGFFLGGYLGGQLGTVFSSNNQVDNWPAIWLSAAGIAAVGVALFAIAFPATPIEKRTAA